MQKNEASKMNNNFDEDDWNQNEFSIESNPLDDKDFIPYNPSNDLNKAMDSKIHLHIKKRNARKFITTVEGLTHRGIDAKKFVNDLKKKLCCNGSIAKNDDNSDEIVQLQGDHREALSLLLQEKYKVDKADIIKHGY